MVGRVETVPRAAVGRAMKVQEVILRAMAKKITWWQAAEIIGLSDRQMRRWRERYEERGWAATAARADRSQIFPPPRLLKRRPAEESKNGLSHRAWKSGKSCRIPTFQQPPRRPDEQTQSGHLTCYSNRSFSLANNKRGSGHGAQDVGLGVRIGRVAESSRRCNDAVKARGSFRRSEGACDSCWD